MKDKLLSIREVAELLAIKEKTLYQWKWRRKNLPFIKVGRSVKISERDLQAFIKSRKIYPTQEDL